MRERAIVLGICGVAWIFAAPELHALDPQRIMTQYVIKDWRRDSGLPTNSVLAIAQTQDRYLWIGTNAGLSRFDGVRFVPAATEDLGGGVAALAAAPDGSLWVAAQDGRLVRRTTDGRFSVLEGFTGGFAITALLPTRDGVLWVATLGAGVYRCQGGHIDQQRPLGVTEIIAMLEDRNGALWMGGRSSGLLRLQGGRWTRYGAGDGLPSETIRSLHQDAQGDLWIGTESGLSRMQGGRFTNFGREQGLAHLTVNALLSDQDGNLWIGTQTGGLQRFSNRGFATLTRQDGLADDTVRVLLRDHEQSLWIGTADGLNRLSDGRFTTFGRPEGLGDATVHTVVEGRNGVIWVGTSSAGAYNIRGSKVRPLGVLPDINPMAIHETRDGSLWLATGDSRLFRVKDGVATEVSPRIEGTVPKVSTMIEDDEGLIVAGATVGLGRIRDREFVRLHPRAPKIHFIFTILRNAPGDFWLGTSNGLVRVQNGEYKTYTKDDGLPNNVVRSISPEADGSLWLATADGLSRFLAGRFQNVTSHEGLPRGVLRVVLDDKQGNLWLSSIGSIFRLSKREIQDFFDKKITKVSPFLFDTADGLRATEVPIGTQHGLRGRDGRLWFATTRGASVISPGQAAVDSAPPPIVIEEMAVDGSKPAAPLAVYPPGQGRFDITYTALTFRAPERILFRYMLSGVDPKWIDVGTKRSAHYANLAPGSYTFRVTTTNSDSVPTGEGATLTFRLQPHWYQHWLFYTLLVLVATGLLTGTYRWRVSEYKSRHIELASKVEERTRTLQQEVTEHKRTEERLHGEITERERAEEEARSFAEKLAHSNSELTDKQQRIEIEMQERRHAEEEAGRERDLLHSLMDNTPDLIYFKDADSRYTRINAACARALGLTRPEEAQGKTDHDFYAQDFARQTRENERELLATGRALLGKVEHDARKGRWYLATKVPLKGKLGQTTGLVGIAKDITERRQAEEKLEKDLEAFLAVVNAAASGDLTRRGAPADGTVGQIARSVNQMLDGFSAILREARNAAFSVSTSASEILATATQIAKGAQYGSDQVHTTSSAVEEMAASMGQVSRNAEQSAASASQVLQHVHEGEASVSATVLGMTRVDAAVSDTTDKMRLLEQRSEQIFEIIALIEEIASQSNLLALNAAIEAAHAGDAGRGFGVVAEEIRQLAQRSTQSTKEATAIVEGIVDETRLVMAAMERGLSEVQAGRELSQRAQQSLQTIQKLVEQSATLAEQISHASREQAQATQTVSQAMRTIAGVSGDSSIGASETSKAVQGLVKLSEQLTGAIARFRIGDDR